MTSRDSIISLPTNHLLPLYVGGCLVNETDRLSDHYPFVRFFVLKFLSFERS